MRVRKGSAVSRLQDPLDHELRDEAEQPQAERETKRGPNGNRKQCREPATKRHRQCRDPSWYSSIF